MRGLNVIDIPFLAQQNGQTLANIPNDSMESYANGALVNGLNGGANGNNIFVISWAGPYFSRGGFAGIYQYDDLEQYSNNAVLDGLDKQNPEERGMFTAAYSSRLNYKTALVLDDNETYSDNAALNGLNGGTNYGGTWTSAYVSR
jgi:hypothetical protein